MGMGVMVGECWKGVLVMRVMEEWCVCVCVCVEWSEAGGRNARIERISKSTRMQPQSYKRWGSSD